MKIRVLLYLMLFIKSAYAQYLGPIQSISSGYGSDGISSVSVTNIVNDHWLTNKISIFYPKGTSSPIPTIFYSHGYGGTDTLYQIETLRHIASKGYAVVYVPYKSLGVTIPERYATLFDGFTKAARTLTTIIDTSRVGFYGHSFGGGATPRMSYRAFKENNWGKNGKFIYCSAPWYSYELGDTLLSNFPVDCKMITILYNDDIVNDHRMGMDIFNNIAINDSIKDCVMVYSDTISGYYYEANHNLPGQNTPESEFDALDYYVTARLLDALADYTFTGNQSAKEIALGNGNTSQIYMGDQLPPLVVNNNPSPVYPQSKYDNRCDSIINERREYCQDILQIRSDIKNPARFLVYPNPTKGLINVKLNNTVNDFTIVVYNQLGEIVLKSMNQTTIDLSKYGDGMYILSVYSEVQQMNGIVIKTK